MRVLVFTDEYDYSYFTFIYNEIKALQNNGVELYIVCERIGKLRKTEMNYRCIPQTKNTFLKKIFLQAYKRKKYFLLSFFKYYRDRKKIIKKFKPDIVHTHFGDTAVRLYFTLEKALKHIPFLVSFHGFDASEMLKNTSYLARLIELFSYKNVHAICCTNHLSDNLEDAGVKFYNEKPAIVHYGVDLHSFNRVNRINNSTRIFLQVSNFVEKKGHIYTLQAFRKFNEKNPGRAKLVLGGNGPYFEKIKLAAVELGLLSVVEFPGWVSRSELSMLMDRSDYFVHHSNTTSFGDQEGMPNAIIEAMAMELPVLSTRHSGIPELVEEGVDGYLVTERDIDTYALRMEDMLNWSYLPSSRKKIADQFSNTKHTEALYSVYKKLV